MRRNGLAAPRHMGSSGPGIEPMYPALVGGFLTTGPPGKPGPFISLDDSEVDGRGTILEKH